MAVAHISKLVLTPFAYLLWAGMLGAYTIQIVWADNSQLHLKGWRNGGR
jgi:hypothetical protein